MFTFYIIFIESSERKFIRSLRGMLVKFFREMFCARLLGVSAKERETTCSAKVSASY